MLSSKAKKVYVIISNKIEGELNETETLNQSITD
jgi:hypothetical protein